MTPQHEDWGFAKTSNNCWQVIHFLMLTSNSNQNQTFQGFKRVFSYLSFIQIDSTPLEIPPPDSCHFAELTSQQKQSRHLRGAGLNIWSSKPQLVPDCGSFFHTKFWQMENASLLWQNNCLLTEMPFTVSTNFQPSLSLPPAFKCLNRVFFSFSIPFASLPISTGSEYIPTCWM